MKGMKHALPCIVIILSLISCTGNTENKPNAEALAEKEVLGQNEAKQQGTVMLTVRGKTELTEEEMERRMITNVLSNRFSVSLKINPFVFINSILLKVRTLYTTSPANFIWML